MSEPGVCSRDTLEALVMARAMRDKAFRRELVVRPKDVLNRELSWIFAGARLPANVEVKVLEDTPSAVYLVLPEAAAVD